MFNSTVALTLFGALGKIYNPWQCVLVGWLSLQKWNLIDGQALDPTSFGEVKSGIWIPKDTYWTHFWH